MNNILRYVRGSLARLQTLTKCKVHEQILRTLATCKISFTFTTSFTYATEWRVGT